MARMDRGFDGAMRKSLTNNRVVLVNNLTNIESIMDHLVQGGVFSDPEMVLYLPRRMDRVRKLMDDLPKRPAKDYWTFLKCLYHDSIRQEHLAEGILKKYEEGGGTVTDQALTRMRQNYLQQQRQVEQGLSQQRHHQQSQQQQLGGPDIVPEPHHLQQNAQPQQESIQQLPPPLLQSHQEQNDGMAQQWMSEAGNMVSNDTMAVNMNGTARDIEVHDGGDGGGSVPMDNTPAPIPASSDGLNNSSHAYMEQRASNTSLVYKMESHPRGFGLIIDIQEFDHLEHRVGSDQDSQRLQHLFEDKLQFEVETQRNLSAQEMLTALSNFCTKLSEQGHQVDGCMVAVLTHGGAGDVLYGRDGDKEVGNDGTASPKRGTFITVPELQSIFSGCSCCGMRNKPKLFIIQACRGGLEDTPAGQRPYERDTDPMHSLANIRMTHNEADMVFLYATVADFVAYRNLFIQILVDVFEEFADTCHVLELQTIINGKMAEKVINNHVFTISEGRTTLTKRWFLNPPTSP